MIRFFIGNGRNRSAAMGGRWGMILGVAMAAALGLVLVTVSIGLLLVLAPVVMIGGLIARARMMTGFPTCALAVLAFPGESWAELTFQGARLVDFVTPKHLDA